ncbi:MAG: DVUA0089 family protein [Methylococcaceae bacterium]|nr:DVUA0089 family protein [Methylococcaceae bacterium]
MMMINEKLRQLSLAIFAVAALAGISKHADATDASFQGTFAQDDNVQLFSFSSDGVTPVTIRTQSYAAGGFDPLLTLYDAWGHLVDPNKPAKGYLNDDGDNGGPCKLSTADPATALCLDPLYQGTLPAGKYWLALTESNNISNSLNIADGFIWTGKGNISGPQFKCSKGVFCDYASNSRTGSWSLDIQGTQSPQKETAFKADGNQAPSFIGGTTTLTVPPNGAALDLKPNLHISDTDIGQIETFAWTVAPSHGTLVISRDAKANSGSADITPGGTITYTLAPGYAGADSFTIQVSDGTDAATRTFSVNVVSGNPEGGFNGNFAQDDNVQLFSFSSDGSTPVTIRTKSYAKGGFDPLLTLFNAWGHLVDPNNPKKGYLNDDGDNGGPCNLATADPATSLCLDSVYQGVLPAGKYWLALTESNNLLNSLNIADGFIWTGKGNISGSQFKCSNGVFCDYAGNNRAGSWSLEIQGAQSPQMESAFKSSGNQAPSFTGGTTTLTAPPNGSAIDLKPDLHVSDTDIGQVETFAWTVAPSHGTLVISRDAKANSGSADIVPGGTITYTLAPGYAGADSFTIQVSDGTDAATRTFSVNVAASNQPPVAIAGGNQTVATGALVTLDGSKSNDPDNGPKPLTYAWTQTSGPNVALTGSNSATPSFTPTLTGAYVFSLKVNDGKDDSLPASVTITVQTVAPPNQPPVALVGGNQSVATGTLVTLDGSKSNDPDNGPKPLTYAWTQTSGSSVTLTGANSANPSFTPTQTGVYVFSLKVNDGKDDSLPATVTITVQTVAPPNQPPVAIAGGNQTVATGALVTLDGSKSSDPDNGPKPLTYIWTQTSGSSVTLTGANSANPSFIPTQTGAYVFSLKVNDGKDDSLPASMTITVQNLTPGFNGGTTTLTLSKNSAAVDLTPNLHVSDTDIGQTETWSQAGMPSHGTLSFSGATANSGSSDIVPGGTITYTPATGYTGADSFAVQVSDGAATAIRIFSVNVVSGNVTPSFNGGTTTLTLSKNGAAVDLTPNLHVSDTDIGQTETWSTSGQPSHGTLSFTGAMANSGSTDIVPGGTITYTSASGYTGTDSFAVQVSDGTATAIRVFSVNVVSGNVTPSFNGGTTTLALSKNSAAVDLTPNLHVSDTDIGQTETWSTSGQPSHGTLSIIGATANSGSTDVIPGGIVTYTPAVGYTGADSFAVQVSDGAAAAIRVFSVNVVGGNMTPSFTGGTTTLALSKNSAAVDLRPNLHVNDTDAGQIETWSTSGLPSHGTLSFTGATASSGSIDIAPAGTITYTPAAGYTGTDSFTVQVSDGTAIAARTFSVTVQSSNLPPIADAGPDQFSVADGSLAMLDGSKSYDPEGAPLSYQWTQTDGPSVALSDGKAAKPQFAAPLVNADTVLTFTLVVTDSDPSNPRTSDGSTVHVTVRRNPLGLPYASATVVAVGGGTVILDGSHSTDCCNPASQGIAKYSWTQKIIGNEPKVSLTADPKNPARAIAKEPQASTLLTFQLVVTDLNGKTSSPATISVSVDNNGTPPEAHATAINGSTIRAGSIKILDGSGSFAQNNNPIAYSWNQTSGPAVTLSSMTAPKPTFIAPFSAAGQTLTFSLKVNDGTLDSSASNVSVQVTDDNNPPTVKISAQPVKEEAQVTLNASVSDPDGDPIASYLWTQTGGTPVLLGKVDGQSLTFTAPWVGSGTSQLTFSLSVTDNFAPNPKSATDTATVRVDHDPSLLDCFTAIPSRTSLWPANKGMAHVNIVGITGPNPYRLSITGVSSDEPVKDRAARDFTAPDARILKGRSTRNKPQPMDSALLRAERQIKQKSGAGSGNGRVYTVNFTANDGFQTCTGSVKVEVPPIYGQAAVDDGMKYDATLRK